MKNNDVIAAYNSVAGNYAKSLAGKQPHAAMQRFAESLAPGAVVLDIGCAGGRDTQRLHDAGLKVTGVDAAEKLLDEARAAHPELKFVQADLLEMPFDDASADGVWANAVFHHLARADMPAALREFRRVLQRGGVLFINTKLGDGLLGDEIFGVQRKFTLLQPDELKALLGEAGFEVAEISTHKSSSRELYWIDATARKL